MKFKEVLVITPPIPFASYTRRFHYEALSEYASVTILPFPISFHRAFNSTDNFRLFSPDNKNINVVPQPIGLPKKLYLGAKLFYFLQELRLRLLLKKYLKPDTVVILTNGDMGPFLHLIPDNLKIAELTDAPWLLDSIDPSSRVDCLSEHLKVLMCADMVFCSSKKLTDFASHLNAHAKYLPNTTKVPDGVSYKPPNERLIFGFIGNINEWLDLALIRRMADLSANIEVRFVGEINGSKPFRDEFMRIVSRAPFKYLPKVPIGRIFDVICQFDICIIPYALTKFNSYVYPNKLIQYLSCGKPIISTAFSPDLGIFGSSVQVAESSERFVVHMREYLSGTRVINKESFDRQRAVALANSARARAKLRMDFIAEYESSTLS